MKTQASWKKGLFVVPEVDIRRECCGAVPIRVLNVVSYWRRVRSWAVEVVLGVVHQSWSRRGGLMTDLIVPLLSARRSTIFKVIRIY